MVQKYAAVGSGRFLISPGSALTGDWEKKRRKYVFKIKFKHEGSGLSRASSDSLTGAGLIDRLTGLHTVLADQVGQTRA